MKNEKTQLEIGGKEHEQFTVEGHGPQQAGLK
jgi:hypothetical protein